MATVPSHDARSSPDDAINRVTALEHEDWRDGTPGSREARVDNISVQALSLQQGGRPMQEKLLTRRDSHPRKAQERKGIYHMLIFLKDKLWELIWPDLILSHLDFDSLKIVFRTWLVMWVLMLFTIIPKVDHFMGPSSFLAMFASGIEISGHQSITMAFVVCMVDLVTIVIAFTCSVVTAGINWRLRGYPTKEDIYKDLAAKGVCKVGDFACLLNEIHHGRYLETRTTVVTIFGLLFSFSIVGYIQTRYKFATLSWLLSSLLTIIVFPFNNFTPFFDPWLYGYNIIVPMGISFATRFVFAVVVFPTSSNGKFMNAITKITRSTYGALSDIIALEHDTDLNDPNFGAKFRAIMDKTHKIYSQLALVELDAVISHYEIAYSRFDRGDLGEFRSRIRLVISAFTGFHSFFSELEEEKEIIEQHIVPLHRPSTLAEEKPQYAVLRPKWNSWINEQLSKNYKASGAFELSRQEKQNVERELEVTEQNKEYDKSNASHDDKSPDGSEASDTRLTAVAPPPSDAAETKEMSLEHLNKSYKAIIERYQVIVDASHNVLEKGADWLAEANEFRLLGSLLPSWRRRHETKQREASDTLIQAAEGLFAAMQGVATSQEWMEPLFEAAHEENRNFLLSVDSLYGFACRHFGKRVSELAAHCLLLDRVQPKPEWVFPWRKGRSIQARFEREYVWAGQMDRNAPDQKVSTLQAPSKVQARDPDSTPPRNVLHLFGILVSKVLDLVYDPDVLFCIKRAGLNVVCLIPYFTRTTAHKAYENWWLWVAVLQGYTIARHAVDGFYGFLAKLVYSFFAGVFGMLSWYMSTGKGHGNHYGYATMMAFLYLYIAFQRHFNKHGIAGTSVVYSCTAVLVTGNSWSSTHYSLPGISLGYGFRVTWIRFVTVTIGIFISFLGTLFPRAYTAKRAIREIVGSCLELIGDLQASISNFGVQRYNDPATHIIAREDEVTSKVRAIVSNMNSAERLRKRLDFEPPLTGLYPRYRYKLLIRFGTELSLMYSLLHYLLDEITDTDTIPSLLQRIGWTSPELTEGVYSLMYMSCRALTDGQALPSVTPGHLSEKYAKFTRDIMRQHSLQRNPGPYPNRDAQLTLTATAIAMQIFERIDATVILIKSLVGEIYDVNISVYDINDDAVHY